MSFRVGVGIVGLGYWGSNFARTFQDVPGAELRWVCDSNRRVRAEHMRRFRVAHETSEFHRMLEDPRTHAVVVATPLATHAQLAREALEAGKHVLVQQPLAFSSDEARELHALAERKSLVLLAGHVLLFHPAMQLLKQSIELGELGDVQYIYASRQNLGRIRRDANVLWSLGAHEIAALLYLLESEPITVSAHGASYLESGGAEVAFCHLHFPRGVEASLHLSWLDGQTVRRLSVVGAKQTAVFDELDASRYLTMYDKGPVPTKSPRSFRFRPGDIASPKLPQTEPLRVECDAFISAIRLGHDPAERSLIGVQVVAVLEALERSLERNALEERVSPPPDLSNVVTLGRRH
jgi:predicted dehydrogenase